MLIDLTHAVNGSLPSFPGDPSLSLKQIADVRREGFADFRLDTTMHLGTHIDAPAHMVFGGKKISDFLPEKFCGRGVVLDARGKSSAGAELLRGVFIKPGDIVLLCFGWSGVFGEDEYYQNYPEISPELAGILAGSGISIIGTDTPSPDRAPYEVHKILFKKDILIIENLKNLETLIGRKNLEIFALPLNVEADAAPCRAVAKV